MFRFTIRDVLWLMVVVAVLCVLVIQRRQYQGHVATLYTQVAALREQLDDLNGRPRSITLGFDDTRELPEGMRRAIVDFPPEGGVSVEYGPIPPEYSLPKNPAGENRQKSPATDIGP